MVWRFFISRVNSPGPKVSFPGARPASRVRPRSSTATFSERMRIRAAPRLLPSSILMSVYILLRACGISATWSPVTASSPQPNEVS